MTRRRARLRTRSRLAVLGLTGLAAASLLHVTAPATAADTSGDTCSDPTAPLDPGCMLGGSSASLVRELCDHAWVDAACSAYLPTDPQYRTDVEPSPNGTLALRIGAMHDHSGYSDGDPETTPADYFRAARTGHNTADDGASDTGVQLDFLVSSDHSDNERIPITTAAVCADPAAPATAATCNRALDSNDQYAKWAATLRQANEATDAGFTAARGFEWTNDYFNHMGVYFSRNVVNVKTDGSYLSMDVMWDWLRKPVEQGGGADALVTFNHPGGDPHLTPLDGDGPHAELLQQLKGGANWNDVAYVPDVDDRVAGIEVNGGDDLSWYVKALAHGWHLGPVAAEDEHQREWASSNDGKTLMLTRGGGARDYYHALRNHRTIALRPDLVDGAPGTKAKFPSILFAADKATPLGSVIRTGSTHKLRLDVAGLPTGSRVALLSNTSEPIQLGTVGADGALSSTRRVARPTAGEDWYFAVVCAQPSVNPCGTDEVYSAVTAPIWLAA